MGAGGGQTAALIASILGSSVIGGVTAPQGQKLKSFDGKGDLSPETLMRDTKGALNDYLGVTVDRANEPITMHTTVNPLPSFKGGALPMAISAPGMDANRLNPALRTSTTPQLPRRTLSNQPSPTPAPMPPPSHNGPPEGDDPNDPYDDNTGPGGISPPSPSDLASGNYSEQDKALAAIQLLTGSAANKNSNVRRTF